MAWFGKSQAKWNSSIISDQLINYWLRVESGWLLHLQVSVSDRAEQSRTASKAVRTARALSDNTTWSCNADLMHRAMRQQLRQEKHKVGCEVSHQWGQKGAWIFSCWRRDDCYSGKKPGQRGCQVLTSAHSAIQGESEVVRWWNGKSSHGYDPPVIAACPTLDWNKASDEQCLWQKGLVSFLQFQVCFCYCEMVLTGMHDARILIPVLCIGTNSVL